MDHVYSNLLQLRLSYHLSYRHIQCQLQQENCQRHYLSRTISTLQNSSTLLELQIEPRAVVTFHLKQTALLTLSQTPTNLPLVASYDTLEGTLGLLFLLDHGPVITRGHKYMNNKSNNSRFVYSQYIQLNSLLKIECALLTLKNVTHYSNNHLTY